MWLRKGAGEIVELPTTGIPLGITEDVTYIQSGPVTLEGGDLLLIGTDGIWEAQNEAGEMFGKGRLRELLADSADRTAAEVRADVVAAVGQFRSRRAQLDDITLVVIKGL